MRLPGEQPDRRRAPRFALRLPAFVRERGSARMAVRVIDISVFGCRIETPTRHFLGPSVWLNLPALEAQYTRVVWCRDSFAALEFETPLHEATLSRLLQDQSELLTDDEIAELRDIATRTRRLAIGSDATLSEQLIKLSRACGVNALIQGLEHNSKP